MNDEGTALQRSQMKKPNLQRPPNSTLSSPFPFMEFGLSASSSLNNILSHIPPKETDLGKRSYYLSRNDAQYSKEVVTDPYLQPLNVDRLKPLNRDEINNGIPNFLRSSTNDLRNNDFSPNIFLRLQSARTDNVNKEFKVTNGSMEYIKDATKIKLLTRDQRPKTAALLLNKRNIFLNGERKDLDQDSLMKPNIPLPPSRPNNGSLMPVLGTKTGTKFYVKSFKTDALIYNSNINSLFPQEVIKDVPAIEKINPEFKNSNSNSLYLQVKNEVAEYRKQRLKEVNMDVENIPRLKAVSVEEFVTKKEDKMTRDIMIKKDIENVDKNLIVENVASKKKSFNYFSDDSDNDENDNNKESERLPRAKSVTFNDKVETREILEESGSDNDRSNDSDENSDDDNSTEDESRGSVVSTETESCDETSKLLLRNLPIVPPTVSQSITKEDSIDSKNLKENNINESSSSEEDTENASEVKPQTKKPSVSDQVIFNDDSTLKDTSLSKSTKSSESFSSSSSSSSNLSNSKQISRPSSALSKLRVNLKKTFKKTDLKKCSKLTMSKQDLLEMKVFKETQLNMPLIFSQYPFVPPVINFVGEGEKIEQLPWQLRKLLRWRTSLLTPIIVKQIITRSGFRPSRLTTATDDLESVETNDWILYFGKHMKGPVFKSLKEYQKVNHFPGSFQLGRKDRLWRNIYKMQQEVGKKEFDFIPQTFCLPTDLELFKQCWENGGNRHKWIIKPPASARGIGVKVVHKWNQIPKRRPIVVQRYISDPYLINESKFDLRLYVFLASIDPLRIYLYDDGLVRFASTKYTNSVKTLHNRFVHLTNYSVNKLNVEYMDNNDNEACKGHKWSLKSLWNYLRKRGVNTDAVWDRIKDLVVKTVISAEEMINVSVKSYCTSTYNIKELFGFDVLLDEHLKPWILEVNVSPSLHSDTPLDVAVKGGMIKDVLNLSGFMLPEHADIDPPTNVPLNSIDEKYIPSSDLHIDQRFWLYTPSDDENAKSKYFVSLAINGQSNQRFDQNETLPFQILDCLTPNDVRCLVESYDEYNRKGHFQRIYPVPSTILIKKYLSCFERVRYSNLLLATFLTKYSRTGQDVHLLEKLCQKKLHIFSSENGDKIDPRHIWSRPSYSGDH